MKTRLLLFLVALLFLTQPSFSHEGNSLQETVLSKQNGLPATMLEGEHSIEANDYCLFLKATALADPQHFYEATMAKGFGSPCILRRGVPGNYDYEAPSSQASGPLQFLSRNDAAAYCSWRNQTEGGALFPETLLPGSTSVDPFLKSNLLTFRLINTSSSVYEAGLIEVVSSGELEALLEDGALIFLTIAGEESLRDATPSLFAEKVGPLAALPFSEREALAHTVTFEKIDALWSAADAKTEAAMMQACTNEKEAAEKEIAAWQENRAKTLLRLEQDPSWVPWALETAALDRAAIEIETLHKENFKEAYEQRKAALAHAEGADDQKGTLEILARRAQRATGRAQELAAAHWAAWHQLHPTLLQKLEDAVHCAEDQFKESHALLEETQAELENCREHTENIERTRHILEQGAFWLSKKVEKAKAAESEASIPKNHWFYFIIGKHSDRLWAKALYDYRVVKELIGHPAPELPLSSIEPSSKSSDATSAGRDTAVAMLEKAIANVQQAHTEHMKKQDDVESERRYQNAYDAVPKALEARNKALLVHFITNWNKRWKWDQIASWGFHEDQYQWASNPQATDTEIQDTWQKIDRLKTSFPGCHWAWERALEDDLSGSTDVRTIFNNPHLKGINYLQRARLEMEHALQRIAEEQEKYATLYSIALEEQRETQGYFQQARATMLHSETTLKKATRMARRCSEQVSKKVPEQFTLLNLEGYLASIKDERTKESLTSESSRLSDHANFQDGSNNELPLETGRQQAQAELDHEISHLQKTTPDSKYALINKARNVIEATHELIYPAFDPCLDSPKNEWRSLANRILISGAKKGDSPQSP